MATESDVVKNYRSGTVQLLSGGPVPRSYICTHDDGDFGVEVDKAGRIVVRSRGKITGLLEGEDPVQQASFTVDMRQFADERTDTDTIVDVIEWTNSWKGLASAAPAGFRFPMHEVRVREKGIAAGDAGDHFLQLNRCLLTWGFKQGERNKISVKVEIYGDVKRYGPGSSFPGLL